MPGESVKRTTSSNRAALVKCLTGGASGLSGRSHDRSLPGIHDISRRIAARHGTASPSPLRIDWHRNTTAATGCRKLPACGRDGTDLRTGTETTAAAQMTDKLAACRYGNGTRLDRSMRSGLVCVVAGSVDRTEALLILFKTPQAGCKDIRSASVIPAERIKQRSQRTGSGRRSDSRLYRRAGYATQSKFNSIDNGHYWGFETHLLRTDSGFP